MVKNMSKPPYVEYTPHCSNPVVNIQEFLEKCNSIVKNPLHKENPDFIRHTDGGFYVFLTDPTLKKNG